jgi:Sec-independent protein secretion pathway component TatC
MGVMLYCTLTVIYSVVSFAGGLGVCGADATSCIITDVLPEGALTTTVRTTLVVGLIISHPLCIYPCAELIEPRLCAEG